MIVFDDGGEAAGGSAVRLRKDSPSIEDQQELRADSTTRLLAAALVAAAILPFSAQAQSLDDIIATWTRLRAIGVYCPKFYRVDIQYLENLQAVFEDTGGAMFPGQVTEARIRQAGARRDAEVEAAGAKHWCTKWRTTMRKDGTGQIWP